MQGKENIYGLNAIGVSSSLIYSRFFHVDCKVWQQWPLLEQTQN